METIVMNQGMLVSGIILAASFILIFTETLHGFHRVKVAMAGAAVMLVVGQSYGSRKRQIGRREGRWRCGTDRE